jgi:hypothetical protein
VYADPKISHSSFPNSVELLNNYKYVDANTPFTYYFLVEDFCETELATRLSVNYKYYWQPDLATPRVEAAPIGNYLYAYQGTRNIFYYTPMDNCAGPGANVNYNYLMFNGYYPFPGSSGIGFVYQTNFYDYFRLLFLHHREIRVSLSGLIQPGIYTVEYELVTRLTNTGGLVGNELWGIRCGGSDPKYIIGGNVFHQDGIEHVLATRTMHLIVAPAPVPPAPDPDPEPLVPADPTTTVAAATIYPNPATDNIKIKFENVEGTTQVKIQNTNGVLLFDQKINVAKEDVDIKLPELKPGIYFVTIISENAVLNRKLVIEPKL